MIAVALACAVVGLVAGWLLQPMIAAETEAPIRRSIPAVATAVLAGAAGWWAGWTWVLPVYLYFAIISVPLAVIDLRTHRLPNRLTLPAYPIVAVGVALPAVADARWADLGRAAIGALCLLVVYGLLHVINPAGMGLGDVKLAGPMGTLLAWVSWSVLLVGTFLGFALGAVVGLALLATKRVGRKSALAFGPYMLAGAWLAILLSGPVDGLRLLP